MTDPLPLTELEFRIALLPPISRGAHLAGPTLHAQRLVGLWKVDDGADVSLAQAFRLLDAETVAGAILRTLMAGDYSSDPRHWIFPPLVDLLPELQECVWQAVLDGTLLVEGIKGVRGTRHRAVLAAELPRLTPDWRLSRLVCDGCDDRDGGIGDGVRDEFIAVRVRRPPAEPIKKAWRDKPRQADVDDAMGEVAREYQDYPPDAPRPAFDLIWDKLKVRCGDVTREQARNALASRAPHLRGQRGYSSEN